MLLTRLYRKYQASLALRAGWWYTIAIFAQKGVVFLAIPIFSNLLSPAEYGTVAIFLSWQTIFMIVVTLNVQGSIGNARYDFQNEKFKHYTSSVMMLGLLGGLVSLAVLALLPSDWLYTVFGLSKPLLLLAVAAAMIMLPVNISMAIWRFNFKHLFYNLVNFLTTAYGIILSVVLIFGSVVLLQPYDRSLARIVGNFAPYLLAGLLLGRRRWVEGQTFYNREFWRYAMVIATPLMFHSLSNVLLDQFDRLMINQYVGRKEAGIYTLAYQFGDISNILWTAANNVWVPWFFRQMERGTFDLIRKRSQQYALAFAALVAGLTIISPLFIRILAPPQYAGAAAIVPVVMATGFFALLYSFYTNVEFYEKKTGYIALMTALSAGVNVGLNALLIPRFGYTVAGWTTLAAFICLFASHASITIFRLKRGYLFDLRLLLALGVGIVALSAVVAAIASG